MISQLQLKNFQSHKETTLDFEDGVNVIIGPSDSGKTSIIRALRWIAWNRPLGDSFRSNWGGDTLAQVHFDDGITVNRFEANNDRKYELANPSDEYGDGNVITFNAFGTEVPEEVQKALNFDEINLQEQMDSPFLISDNPGQVSRHFNKIANIDIIDSSLRKVEGWVRSIRNDKKAAENEIKRYEEKLKDFDYLDKMEADIEVLEQLEGRYIQLNKKASSLRKLISQIENTQEEIQSKSQLLPAKKPVSKLLELYEEKEQTYKKFSSLRSLYQNIKQTQQRLSTQQELVKDKEAVDSILDLHKKKEEVKQEIKEIRSKMTAIKGLISAIKEQKQILEDLEDRWHQEAPDTCPLCNGTGKLN